MRHSAVIAACMAAFALTYVLVDPAAGAAHDRAANQAEHADVVLRATARELREERAALQEFTQDLSTMMAAAPQVPAAATSGPDEQDADWDRYPRSSFPLARWLAMAPDRPLRPEDLYRHRELNPEDRYVEQSAREMLAIEVAAYLHLLSRAAGQLEATANAEITALVDAGVASSVPIDSLRVESLLSPESTQLEHIKSVLDKRGLALAHSYMLPPTAFFSDGSRAFWMQVRGKDQRVYGARLDEMPLTRDYVALKQYVQPHLCSVLTGWARALCLIDDASSASLMGDLNQLLEAQRR